MSLDLLLLYGSNGVGGMGGFGAGSGGLSGGPLDSGGWSLTSDPAAAASNAAKPNIVRPLPVRARIYPLVGKAWK